MDPWIKKFVFVQSLTMLNSHSFLSIGLFKQLQFASIYYKALKKNLKCQLPFSWSSRHVLWYPSAISRSIMENHLIENVKSSRTHRKRPYRDGEVHEF